MSKHHVIFKNKTQGGTNHPANIINLPEDEHFAIHHGANLEEKKRVLTKCYDHILPNLHLCWKAKIKPKIIRLLENSNGDYTEIFNNLNKLGLK